MKKSLVILISLIVLLNLSFVSANFFDWMTGHDVRQVSSESGAKYNLEIKNVAPAGSGKSFVRGTITRPDGIQEEISAYTGEETILQRGEVVSVSKTPTNKPFGRKNIEVSIQENKLEEAEGVLFFSHFHENVGAIDEESGDEYYLYSDNQQFKIVPENEEIKLQLNKMIGQQIKIEGTKADNQIILNSIISSKKLEKPLKRLDAKKEKSAKTLQNQTQYQMAVFLIEFLDSGARPFSASEAEEKIFSENSGTLRTAIEEQSYNKTSVNGKVFDWITMPRNSQDPPAYPTTAISQRCYAMDQASNQFVQEEVLPLISQTTKDELLKYNRIYFLTYCPQYQLNLGGYGSIFTIKSEESIVGGFTMFNFNNFPSVWNSFIPHMEHEFLHMVKAEEGYILPHAGAYDCDEEILEDSCTFLEAGNCFDIMGKVGNTGICSQHLNAGFKESLGWFSKKDILIIDKSGTYKLNPLEFFGEGKKAAKIQIKNPYTTPFYLEFRQPIGLDSNLNNQEINSNQNGIFILRNVGSASFSDSSSSNYVNYLTLLDAKPTALNWGEDVKEVTLNGNNVFFDKNTNVKIGPIENVNSQEITFNVTIISSFPLCASTLINSKPFMTSSTFSDVYFFDSNYGWTINKFGEVFNSKDGGNSWDLQYAFDSFYPLKKIYFFNQTIGWIISDKLWENPSKSVIFYTKDGGKTWTTQSELVDFGITDMKFIDQSTSWIAGAGGVLKTIDGGKTWQQKNYPGTSASKISFTDVNNAWILKSPSSAYYTNDGGETWTSKPLVQYSNIADIYFIDQNTGWIAGKDPYGIAAIYKTTDNGQSWTQQIATGDYPSKMMEIYFKDANTGWAKGYSSGNTTLFSTNNGGQTWSEIFTKQGELIEARSYFMDKDHLWLNTGKKIYCLNLDNSREVYSIQKEK